MYKEIKDIMVKKRKCNNDTSNENLREKIKFLKDSMKIM